MKARHDPCSSPASTTSRANGRPSLYTPELASTILAFVRERGLSPTAAAEESGLNRGTLSRWRMQHPSFDERLHHARVDYRRIRLGRARSATTRDGRPNWRTAAWELEHAFPEDYCMNPKRRAAFQAMRDAEFDDLERARAEYETELAEAEAEAAAASGDPFVTPVADPTSPISPEPAPRKLQNPPGPLRAEPPTGEPRHTEADRREGGATVEKLQNPTSAPAGPISAEREKLQYPAHCNRSAAAGATAAESAPQSCEKLQNPPDAALHRPLSEADRAYLAALEEDWQSLYRIHGVNPA